MLARTGGVIAAIAIIFSLEYWLRAEWYIAVPLGILGYLVVSYGAKRDRISNRDTIGRRGEKAKGK